MDWFAPIDIYCERLGPGFWAEPLNAVSNAAFLVAAALAAARMRRARRHDRPVALLVALVALIGIGSFLFHTFANRWSMLADTLPIALFIYFYLGLALRRFLGLGLIATLVGLVAFAGLSAGLEAGLRPLLGGSAGYVPALLAMLGIGGVLRARSAPPGAMLLAAGAVFAVSLGFRIADLPLCDANPAGTHFLWHVLNGTTLGILLMAALAVPRHAPAARPAAGPPTG
ncbi:ceramidase domain-containing protein [Faunimonas sp. B44]|uniref:ceramidase domain-containing protein n=1 Tax=Faunimonas sp. B44 TaxID=3461493 RepID=UPI00404447AE